MFEKEIQFITDFNLNKIKKLGSFFTLDDLTKAKVHPAIVQYLSAEIDYLIFLDRQSLLQKSVFDYSGPEIVKHFLAISQEIKKAKLLPYEEVKKIVQQAVTFQLTFLLRPVWTLKKFVFDTTEVRSQEEVKLFFNYTYFYDYYKKIFLTILEKKQLLTISIYEFESLLEKIQAQLLEQQMKNVFENALIDTAEFLNSGEVSKTKLSIETLEIFLKDKNLQNLVLKTRKLLAVDPKQKFELSEINAALFNPAFIGHDDEESAKTPKDETQLDIFQSAEAALNKEDTTADDLLKPKEEAELEDDRIELEGLDSVVNENLVLGMDDGNVKEILLQEDEDFLKEEEIEDDELVPDEEALDGMDFLEPGADELPPAKSEKKPDTTSVPFEKYFQEEMKKNETSMKEDPNFENEEALQPVDETTDEENDEASDKQEIDIFTYFTTKETMKIIGAIFNQDSLDFVNTLERITECANEDEANQILKDVFLSYRVNSVGKEAAMLKGKIVQYFRDKEF